MPREETVDQAANVGRLEALFFQHHVFPVLQGGNDAGVGRRPADAVFLQGFYKAGLGEAGRRLGEMLLAEESVDRQGFALLQRRQLGFLFLIVFLVYRQKSGEGQGLSGGAKGAFAHRDVGGDGVELCGGHLRGHGTLPDQFIETCLVVRQVLPDRIGCAGDGSRSHCLVRFLRVLGLGLVLLSGRRQEVLVEVSAHMLADVCNRFLRQVHRVSPHVGDETNRAFAQIDPFVQLLSGSHHPVGGHAELANAGLLQGRGGERWCGMAGAALFLHAHDTCFATFQRCQPFLAARLVLDRKLVEFFALEMGHSRGKCLDPLVCIKVHRPVFTGDKGFDLLFPLDDHAQRRRLNPSGAQSRTDFFPQQRRQIEADQIIKRASRLLGIDQIGRDFTRIAHRILNCRFGDFIKGYALHWRLDLAFLEDFADMPGNCLAFAVRVGCQQDFVSFFGRLDNGLDMLGVALDNLVFHAEIFGVDSAGLWLEVADVAIAGEYLVIRPEILLQCFGFGGRFDNDKFGHFSVQAPRLVVEQHVFQMGEVFDQSATPQHDQGHPAHMIGLDFFAAEVHQAGNDPFAGFGVEDLGVFQPCQLCTRCWAISMRAS